MAMVMVMAMAMVMVMVMAYLDVFASCPPMTLESFALGRLLCCGGGLGADFRGACVCERERVSVDVV